MGAVASDCGDPRVGALLTAYCFGTADEQERQAVETHILLCDHCWHEVRRLESSVRVLRSRVAPQPALPPDQFVSVFGLSGRLMRRFAGHATFAVAIALLYGAEWSIGVWTELGYAYDRFGNLAWLLFGPVGVWVAATMLAALWVGATSTRRGETNGAFRSAAVTIVGLGALVAVLVLVLPAESTIQASFQTRTASAGYFKDAILIFAPLLPFILPPFHTVVRLQSELLRGRHEAVFDYLTGQQYAVSPRGLFYLSPRILVAFLVIYGAVKLVGANHMLDALTPGPYANLFTMASYASTAVWFAIAVAGLVWYVTNLEEIKRECLALHKLPTA